MTDPAHTYRSTTNTVIAICAWAGAAGCAILVLALAPAAPHRLWGLVPLVFGAVLATELFWRPRIHWDDERIVLVDPFHTVEVPWSVVVDIDTRFALTVVTPTRRYRASAAPAGGVFSRPRLGRDSIGPAQQSGAVRTSDALGTDSGDAAYVIRQAWTTLVEQERIPLGRAGVDRPVTRAHVGAIAVCAALAALTVLAVLNL